MKNGEKKKDLRERAKREAGLQRAVLYWHSQSLSGTSQSNKSSVKMIYEHSLGVADIQGSPEPWWHRGRALVSCDKGNHHSSLVIIDSRLRNCLVRLKTNMAHGVIL